MNDSQKRYIKTKAPEGDSLRALILYRPFSEYSRSVEEFVQNFERTYPENAVVLMDVDSIEGSHMVELYDILQYPAVLVLTGDGSMINSWVGVPLPLIDDVAGFMRG
jgi:hypothetical protein